MKFLGFLLVASFFLLDPAVAVPQGPRSTTTTRSPNTPEELSTRSPRFPDVNTTRTSIVPEDVSTRSPSFPNITSSERPFGLPEDTPNRGPRFPVGGSATRPTFSDGISTRGSRFPTRPIRFQDNVPESGPSDEIPVDIAGFNGPAGPGGLSDGVPNRGPRFPECCAPLKCDSGESCQATRLGSCVCLPDRP